MKLPEASENIYPKTEENLRTLLEKYFRQSSNEQKEQSIKSWFDDNFYTLNQLEFGARFAVENEDLLDQANFSRIPSARVNYAIMAIFMERSKWSTSGANTARLEKFRELYRDSFFNEWPE